MDGKIGRLMASKTERKNTNQTFSPTAPNSGRTIAYLRVSTDRQDVDGQRLVVLDHARSLGLVIDEIIEMEISSRKSLTARRVDELTERLGAGDTLLVSELSRLGRSLTEVVSLINALVASRVRVIAVKQGIDIKDGKADMAGKVMVAMFSLLAELERDLISERTKSALAARKRDGVRLGRPKGSTGVSRLDDKRDTIQELLRHRVSRSAIARMLGVGKTTVNDYIKSRELA